MIGVIDRFEGDFCVVVFDNGEIKNIAKKEIPHDAKEGDVILVNGEKIAIDKNETLKRKKEIEKYMGLWED